MAGRGGGGGHAGRGGEIGIVEAFQVKNTGRDICREEARPEVSLGLAAPPTDDGVPRTTAILAAVTPRGTAGDGRSIATAGDGTTAPEGGGSGEGGSEESGGKGFGSSGAGVQLGDRARASELLAGGGPVPTTGSGAIEPEKGRGKKSLEENKIKDVGPREASGQSGEQSEGRGGRKDTEVDAGFEKCRG
ncbi:unnamed protein product, partial [Scytosiphon promiscuus]